MNITEPFHFAEHPLSFVALSSADHSPTPPTSRGHLNSRQSFSARDLRAAAVDSNCALIIHHGSFEARPDLVLVGLVTELVVVFSKLDSGIEHITSRQCREIASKPLGMASNNNEITTFIHGKELNRRAICHAMGWPDDILHKIDATVQNDSYMRLANAAVSAKSPVIFGLRGLQADPTKFRALRVDGMLPSDHSDSSPYPLRSVVGLLVRRAATEEQLIQVVAHLEQVRQHILEDSHWLPMERNENNRTQQEFAVMSNLMRSLEFEQSTRSVPCM